MAEWMLQKNGMIIWFIPHEIATLSKWMKLQVKFLKNLILLEKMHVDSRPENIIISEFSFVTFLNLIVLVPV